jgi:hypothetical protein
MLSALEVAPEELWAYHSNFWLFGAGDQPNDGVVNAHKATP